MGRRFLPGFAAHVTDVEAAFPMLPFAPWVWPFMFHRFYASEGDPRALHLYCHLTGDFGTRGMPGVFKIFFVDVVLNMARAAHVLTIPLSVYVDDLCATGPKASAVTRRVVTFQAWAEEVCGVTFKQKNGVAGAALRGLLVGLLRGHAHAGGAQAVPVHGHVPRLLGAQDPVLTREAGSRRSYAEGDHDDAAGS